MSGIFAPIIPGLAGGQEANDFLCKVVGHLLNLGNRLGGQRAGQDYYADAGHAQGIGTGLGCPVKSAGDDAHGRNTPGLGHNCVVETPRRAGPSISYAVYYSVTLLNQLVQSLFGARGAEAELTAVNHLLGLVFLHQYRLQLF